MSSLAEFSPEVILQIAQSTFPSDLNLVSAAVLLYWDFFLSINHEIAFIWMRPFNLVSVLYILMRYLPIISQTVDLAIVTGIFNTTHNICGGLLWFTDIATTAAISIADIFFIFRIYAFYARNKTVLTVLGIAYVICTIINFVFASLTGTEYRAIPTTILAELFPRVIDECITSSIPKLEFAVLITELIFQTLLFGLVLGRFVYLQIEAYKLGRGTNQLYIIFFRDGLWAYFFFFVFFLTTAILIKLQVSQALPLEYYIVSFLGIIPPRILLNLKELGGTGFSHVSEDQHTSTSISFTASPKHNRNILHNAQGRDLLQSDYPMENLTPREVVLNVDHSSSLKDVESGASSDQHRDF